MNAVVSFAHPAHRRPDVSVLIATDAIGETGYLLAVDRHRHGCELASVLELSPIDVPHFDVFWGVGVMGRTGVSGVDFLVIGREAEAVWLEDFVSHLADRSVWIDAIDSFFEVEFAFETLEVDEASVSGIGEPD